MSEDERDFRLLGESSNLSRGITPGRQSTLRRFLGGGYTTQGGTRAPVSFERVKPMEESVFGRNISPVQDVRFRNLTVAENVRDLEPLDDNGGDRVQETILEREDKRVYSQRKMMGMTERRANQRSLRAWQDTRTRKGVLDQEMIGLLVCLEISVISILLTHHLRTSGKEVPGNLSSHMMISLVSIGLR